MASGSVKKYPAISYVDIFYTGLTILSNGTTTFNLSQTFDNNVIGVELKRAWPESNWNSGAIVSIVKWNFNQTTGTVSVTLSTTSSQPYGVAIRVYYEE